ncbi:MAG: dockerin type I domain-containing protein [Usitatibacteraceae bacterium]
MKTGRFCASVSTLLAALAGFAALALASGSAAAQSIVVNGVSCPTASVNFSLAGLIATLPATCSGNGNPCESAIVTLTANGIIVSAPTACLTASPIATPTPLRFTNVNGNPCAGATVTFAAGGFAIDAPSSCLTVAPLAPIITSIGPNPAIAGQSVTITGSNLAGASVTVGGISANVLSIAGSGTSFTFNVPSVAAGTQPVVVTTSVLPAASTSLTVGAPPVNLLAVHSRKVHGTAGTFDLPIDTTQPISAAVAVEPRLIGSGHTIVFQFDGAINAAGTASAVDGSGAALPSVTVQASGNNVIVTMPNVPDRSRATVTLVGVNGNASAVSASLGFLAGDVNSSRSVNSSDISALKSRSGQTVDALSFKFDVNASGAINSSDISAAKSRSGLTLP